MRIFKFFLCTIAFAGLALNSLSQHRHIDILEETGYDYRRTVDQMERDRIAGIVTDSEYKHYMRWKIATEPYLERDAPAVRNEYRIFKEYQKFLASPRSKSTDQRVPNGHWSSVIPTQFSPTNPLKPINGRLNCVAVHPTDQNIIYVGAPVGGVWKSVNGGNSWICMTDGVPFNSISAIEFHPDDANHIYALTGDGDGRNMASMGLIESLDGGHSWSLTNLDFNVSSNYLRYGYDMLINSTHPQTMYVATNRGIYATNDSWNSWHRIHDSIVFDIEFKSGTTTTLYAAAETEIFRFDSVGTHFVKSNLSEGEGPSAGLPNPETVPSVRTAIAVTPADPDRIYALYARNGDGNGYLGLYMSEDSGESFSLQSNSPNITGDGDRNQASYDLELAVHPEHSDRVYVGGVLLYRSFSEGEPNTWFNISNVGGHSIHADIHDIYFHSASSHMYVATDGGISYSPSAGGGWTNLSDGLNIMQFYDIDVRHVPGIDHIVAGGTQDNGTNQWVLSDTVGEHILGGDGFETIYDPSDISTIYASTQSSRRRSINGGSSWVDISPPGDSNNWDASWIMHPTDYDTMYCAQHDIKRTFDRGNSWDTLFAGFTETIRAMAQSVSNPNVLYASDRYKFKFTANLHSPSITWFDRTPNLPVTPQDYRQIGAICVNPDDPSHVWITYLNYSSAKVYFSEDAGSSWVNWSNSLLNTPIHCIAYNPGSPNGVYIGTDIGVWYRDSTMTAWQYFGNGLPRTQITDLKVIDGYLYAGTYGRGVWRSPLLTPCPSETMLTQTNDPSSPNHTGHQRYYVSNQLVSSRVVTGGIGTDVKYVAGGNVRLVPGFEVHKGNIFRAHIGGCIFE